MAGFMMIAPVTLLLSVTDEIEDCGFRLARLWPVLETAG